MKEITVSTHCDCPVFLATVLTLQLLGVRTSTDDLHKVVRKITYLADSNTAQCYYEAHFTMHYHNTFNMHCVFSVYLFSYLQRLIVRVLLIEHNAVNGLEINARKCHRMSTFTMYIACIRPSLHVYNVCTMA